MGLHITSCNHLCGWSEENRRFLSLCSIHHPKLLGYPDLTHTRGKQSQAEMKLDHFCGFVALFSVQIESLTKHSCTRRKYDNHFSSVYLKKECVSMILLVWTWTCWFLVKDGPQEGGVVFVVPGSLVISGICLGWFGLVMLGAVKLLVISSQKFQTAAAVSQLVCWCIGDDSTLPLCPDVLCLQLQSVAVSPCLTVWLTVTWRACQERELKAFALPIGCGAIHRGPSYC